MSISPSSFQYDALPDGYFRLFKLDLESPPDQLRGKIFSRYLPGQLDLTKKGMWKDFFSDSDLIMDALADDDKYDALSYVWGSSEAKHPLGVSAIGDKLVDEKPVLNFEPHRNGIIYINDNLHSFLQEALRRNYNRFLWIDALCICQSDNAEKSVQIPKMKSIYNSGAEVLVWLGDISGDAIRGAIAIMPAITEKLNGTERGDFEMLDPEQPESFDRHDLPEPSHPIWRAYGTIMTRPWWTRVWTLQEAVLAPAYDHGDHLKFWHGSSTITWNSISAFALALYPRRLREWTITGSTTLHYPTLHGYDSMDQIRACRVDRTFAVTLPLLLFASRRRNAAVAADYVFGITGMLSEHKIRNLAIDVSLPTEDVFLMYGKHYIRNEIKECLLNHVASVSRLPELPSWCPTLSSPEETVSLGSHRRGLVEPTDEQAKQLFSAGFTIGGNWERPERSLKVWKNIFTFRGNDEGVYDTKNPRQIALMQNKPYIKAFGIYRDKVVDFIDCNPGLETMKPGSHEALLQLHAWERSCFALASKVLPKSSLEETYSRTLVADFIELEPTPITTKITGKHNCSSFAPSLARLREYLQALSSRSSQTLNSQARDYLHTLQRVTLRRRFFVTCSGRIGLGPSDTQIGDTIHVFFYCPTPYLLRDSDEGRKRFVGEAYMHGEMYGEVLEMLEKKDVDEMSWIIE